MAEILPVVKVVFPDSSEVPPVPAAYQSIVSPLPGVAVMDTIPVPQRALFPAVGADGLALIVRDVDGVIAAHPPDAAMV